MDAAQTWLMVLAVVDPITGGSGWVGAGLLGSVLGWLLLFHLPAKDKIMRDVQAEHLAYSQSLLDRHDKAVTEQQAHFSAALKTITDHCEAELGKISARFSESTQAILDRLDARHAAGSRQEGKAR